MHVCVCMACLKEEVDVEEEVVVAAAAVVEGMAGESWCRVGEGGGICELGILIWEWSR